LGLRLSCVSDACGALFRLVLREDRCACVGDRVGCSGAGLSQQGFELGEDLLDEDLLDRIEVGRGFGQEHKTRSCGSNRLSDLSLVRAEVVQDHDIARFEGGREKLFAIGAEAFAVDWAVEQTGSIRSWRRAARKVAVFQCPGGILSTSRSPRGAQPRRRVMFVFVQVSSMKTRREDEMGP
jgi:hypothetical protein